MDDTVRPRWQYSLKTYLMVIAVAIGWWCDRQRLQSQLDEARRRIQVLETSPYYDVIPLVR